MSAAVIALAALFTIGMMGLGLTLFVKGAREEFDFPKPLSDWPRHPG